MSNNTQPDSFSATVGNVQENLLRYYLKDEFDYIDQTIMNVSITAITEAHKNGQIDFLDNHVANVMESVYPLDVFSRDVKGDTQQQHVAGIYHGLHILRREARELSAREDLTPLPQETEEYYKKRAN